MFLIIIIVVIFTFYILNHSNRKKGYIFGVVSNDGLGNRIAGIPGAFLLSLLSNRHFHSINSDYTI